MMRFYQNFDQYLRKNLEFNKKCVFHESIAIQIYNLFTFRNPTYIHSPLVPFFVGAIINLTLAQLTRTVYSSLTVREDLISNSGPPSYHNNGRSNILKFKSPLYFP